MPETPRLCQRIAPRIIEAEVPRLSHPAVPNDGSIPTRNPQTIKPIPSTLGSPGRISPQTPKSKTHCCVTQQCQAAEFRRLPSLLTRAVVKLSWNREPSHAGCPVANHPNKHIRAAIKYAEDHGWTFTKAGGQAHIFGTLWCRQGDRTGCRFRVFSTPQHPEDHARRIRRAVDQCPH